VRGAQHDGVGLPGEIEVVAVAALACEEAKVLFARDWFSDAGVLARRDVHFVPPTETNKSSTRSGAAMIDCSAM
jgi:hypothetical protein